MNDLELRHLRCVVILAEEQNFGRAAARLNMSQPPLTRLLSEVERIVGAKLFERTTRRVAVTPVGTVFVAEAREVLARADAAWENIQTEVRRQSGQIRLAYTPLALQTILPQILTAFREREHDAIVDLVGLAGGERAALSDGRVEVAFASEPIEEPGYANILLHREPLALLVPEGHRLAELGSVVLNQLVGVSLILHPRHEYPDYYDRVIAAVQASGIVPEIYHRELGQNCTALVVGGKGVLLTSRPHNNTLPPGLRLIHLETAHRLHEEIWATWRKERISCQARVLTELLEAYALMDGSDTIVSVAPPGGI